MWSEALPLLGGVARDRTDASTTTYTAAISTCEKSEVCGEGSAMLSTGIPSPIATDGIDDATEALRRSRGHPSTSVQRDKTRGRISHGPRTTPSIKTPAHTADHGKCHESRRCTHASARMHARTHARAQARTHAGGLAENTRSPPNAEAATNARDIDA